MKTQPLKRAAPKGYSTVCPYLMVNDIEKLLLFLKEVLDAEIKEKLPAKDGSIRHAEVGIGECLIMIGKVQPGYPDKGMVYVFVNEVDAVFKKALANGAKPLMEPGDRFYGYREGGFEDPSGHQWWIATVVEEVSP